METQKRNLTYKEKDILLDYLIAACTIGEHYANTNYTPICQTTGLSEQEIHALLEQFDEHGLIDYSGHVHYGNKSVEFTIKQEAVDFKLHGGFQMEEEIFDKQMSKLFIEIENLEKKFPVQDLANISTIATGLLEISKEIFKK